MSRLDRKYDEFVAQLLEPVVGEVEDEKDVKDDPLQDVRHGFALFVQMTFLDMRTRNVDLSSVTTVRR
jgi:hypothetical protein